MNTAVVNIRTSPQAKAKAKAIASELGFSLSSLINAFLKQLIKTKKVTFSVEEEEPTKYLLDALKESKEDIKAGRVISFNSPNDAVKYLDRMIDNERKSKKN
ncbi:MAG: type II toxin-antitoxin system RelB/DinJ family antitoxin [Candidatus Berkelbacteria bacterium]|nr:type II toxin-antitoxin system RelB/DinJ family antitoxin [Candidatus Berkelbacteria bacterium]